MRKLLIIISLFLILNPTTQGLCDWQGPVEIIKGNWGTENSEFGFESEDTSDSFPRKFAINLQENIFISDELNKCVKVFDRKGKLISVIKPENVERIKYGWPGYLGCDSHSNIYTSNWDKKLQKYSINGDLIWGKNNIVVGPITTLFDDSIVILGYREGFKNKEKYIHISPDGKILNIDIDRPMVLGSYGSERDIMWKEIITVQFPEKTFQIPNNKFYSDHIGNVYVIKYIQDNPKNSDLHIGYVFSDLHYKILRYGFYSTSLSSEYDFPKNKKRIGSKNNTVGYSSEIVFEYGSPVVSPNGNIYCWKRTPDTYGILKWTWKDEKNKDLVDSLEINKCYAIDGPASIRSKPNGKVIESLPNGKIIRVVGTKNNDWYKIEYSNVSALNRCPDKNPIKLGWTFKKNIRPQSPPLHVD